MRRSAILFLLVMAASSALFAQALAAGQEIPLWPKAAPGSEGLQLTEYWEGSATAPQPNRVVARIQTPSIYAFPAAVPAGAANSGVSVIVIPGGGFTNIQFDKEGTEIAKWLNTLGVTAFVLKHRLPGEGHKNGKDVPAQDVQRALRLVRSKAAAWGLNPAKIGVMGLSAGGHLASVAAVGYNKVVYKPVDAVDQASARPDFCVLAYAPISTNAAGHELPGGHAPITPVEKQQMYDDWPTDALVDAQTPPTFIVAGGKDEKVPVENSLRFYEALRAAKVSADLHIYQGAPHGFALRAKGPVAGWTELCRLWMEDIGLFR